MSLPNRNNCWPDLNWRPVWLGLALLGAGAGRLAAAKPELMVRRVAPVASKQLKPSDPKSQNPVVSHWAFRPPTRPPEPKVNNTKWVRTPVDRFILSALEKQKLAPAPEADRVTLIRRLSFDLLGLPPTPKAVEEFVADPRKDAYEQLVERLLASPQYGERWGRHWLDAAGYADSNGYFNADSDRPLAYKYRDYVVKAFNDDKPFDRFISEQLAGDELAGFTPDAGVTPAMAELLIATHFLRNAPDGTGESDGNAGELRADRYAVLEGNVQLIGSALLGLTVQCARCHNHKFEPVLQAEYYSLQALLKPVYNHDNWKKPNERVVTSATRTERETHQRAVEESAKELKAQKDNLEGLIAPFRKQFLQENLEKLPEADRAPVRQALDTDEKKRTEEMKTLLKKHAAWVQIKDEEVLKRYPEMATKHASLGEAIKKMEAEKPQPLPQIAAVIEVNVEPPPHHLLKRGNYGDETKVVEPGVPAVLCDPGNLYQIEKTSSTKQNSGRRLAFARWLTSPSHPVFARLTVNRLWQHHFGTGLVATPDNFGVTGAKPTHPELLDWLAVEFIQSGWGVKAMHRLIVNSATYRCSTSVTATARKLISSQTPDPRPQPHSLLARFPLQRLEAESIRDAMLFVSGELDLKPGGPYTPAMRNAEGQMVVDESRGDAKRRSIYLQQRRTMPSALLEVFDAPQMNPACARRNTSTVALQSLTLLNSEFVRARSRAFAARVAKEAGTETDARLDLAFRLAYGRAPGTGERTTAKEFLQSQLSFYAEKPDADAHAWTDFCQMLLASSAFLYVE